MLGGYGRVRDRSLMQERRGSRSRHRATAQAGDAVQADAVSLWERRKSRYLHAAMM